jgi:hypothetical protein
MGKVGQGTIGAVAVTKAARQLAEQDSMLRFGRRPVFAPSNEFHPNKSEATEYFDSSYFPPIVSFGQALNRAQAKWEQLNHVFVPVGWPR